MSNTNSISDHEQIRSLLRSYVATWNSRKVSGLKSHWDASLLNPVYIAEESEAMFDWPSIEKYWAALDGLDVTIKVSDPRLSQLTTDVVAAVYDMHWRIAFDSHPHWQKPIGGNVRVSVTLARRANGWKIVSYAEAPFATALQVKKWLERDAAD